MEGQIIFNRAISICLFLIMLGMGYLEHRINEIQFKKPEE